MIKRLFNDPWLKWAAIVSVGSMVLILIIQQTLDTKPPAQAVRILHA